MALSKEEQASIRHESQNSQEGEKPIEKKPKNKKIIFFSISSVFIVLIVAGIGYSYIQSNKPGVLDDFARCLTDKGAVMYGASFCQYSHAQKGMFGSSQKYLDIRDFSKDPNVRTTPTWYITGEYYPNVQSFDRLASLTGCKIRQ